MPAHVAEVLADLASLRHDALDPHALDPHALLEACALGFADFPQPARLLSMPLVRLPRAASPRLTRQGELVLEGVRAGSIKVLPPFMAEDEE